MYDRDLWGATISGANAVPLGFGGASFGLAMKNRPQRSPGQQFMAYVIESECPTVRHIRAPLLFPPDQLWEKGRGMDRIDRVLTQLRLAWELNSEMQFGEFLALALGLTAGPKFSKMTDNELVEQLLAAKRASRDPATTRKVKKRGKVK